MATGRQSQRQGVASAAADPERMMISNSLMAGRLVVVCGLIAAGLSVAGAGPGRADDAFPFGQELLLDAPPMRPGKRMPGMTVERGGNAVLDLWCRSVAGRVEISESAIRIETGPLPDELPSIQGSGQCTPERMRADEDMLAALTQATSWRPQGTTVILEGPTTLRFRNSDH
jgi:hypothetical protein